MKYLLLLPFLVSSLWAQIDNPPKHLRFIPLGEMPTWPGDKLKKGIRIPNKFPPGAFLPKKLSLLSGKEKQPLQLNLKTFTKLLTLDGKAPNLLIEKGNLGAGQEWLKNKAPAAPLSLGVIYRDHQKMNWDNPQMLLLKDDATSFPAGKARFVNVSDTMVLIRIGGEKTTTYGIPPGKSALKPLKAGENNIWIGYQSPEKPFPKVLDNNFTLRPGERIQFFCYKPQNKNPRKPFLVEFKPEKPPGK